MTSSDDAPGLALTTHFAGPVMLERVSWYDDARFVVPLSGMALIVLLIVLALEVVRSIRDRATTAGPGVRARSAALAAGQILFTVLFAIGLAQLAIANDDRFAFGIPLWFSAVLLVPLLLWVMTAALGILLLRRSTSDGGASRRAWPAFAASLALCFVQWSWHLYGM